MLTKEVLINSLRPYCGVIMEYDRRSGRLCIHWGDALTDGVRQRWLMPAQLREEIRRSGTAVSEEAAVWYRYLNAGYLQSFFRRGAESEEFRMEFQTSDRQMKRYDIRVEKLDADTLLISGRVVREDGVDALTGVYSRSYYEMHMKAGAVRGGVAIIDLDDLKLCNDTYGHDGGDKLLTAAAQVMQDAAGMDGQVVRYGGDEFLLLLPGVGENDFPAVLEDVRARIAALRLPEQSGLRLTASIGGVMARDETVADAVLRADRLMYRAKQRKDCVILEGQAADDSAPEEQAPLLLVVDDAPLNRELLMAMLGDEYRYLEASDGAACLELLEQYGTGIEMVLLDMVMPGMDGIRVLEEMNRRHYIEDIPVVLVTADDSGQYIRRAYELGVADYISRPFDAQVVYRRVTNTVRLYARQRRVPADAGRLCDHQHRIGAARCGQDRRGSGYPQQAGAADAGGVRGGKAAHGHRRGAAAGHAGVPGRAAAGDGGGDLPLAPRAVRRRRLSRRAEGGRHPHLGAGGIAGRCVRRAGEPAGIQGRLHAGAGHGDDPGRPVRRVQSGAGAVPDGHTGRAAHRGIRRERAAGQLKKEVRGNDTEGILRRDRFGRRTGHGAIGRRAHGLAVHPALRVGWQL